MTSRSFGDMFAHSIGVSAVPEVNVRNIHPDEVFLIMGSDGLWEFLTNRYVGKILKNYGNNLEKCAYKLYKTASKLW